MNTTNKNIYNTTLMILSDKSDVNKKDILEALNKIIDIFGVTCNKTEILKNLYAFYLIKE